MLTDEERYRFDLQGFLVRRGVLSGAEIAQVHEQIDGLNLPAPGESVQSQRFTGLLEAGGLLRNLVDHDAVLDVVREFCGPQVRLDHAYGIVMAPGTAGLGLHGGGVPFDPAQYYLVDSTGIHTGLIAVQWAISDHAQGEGGFCCIPGSHKAHFGKPASIGSTHSLVREVPLQPGDVVMFTEALTHGTLPWTAPHQRRSLLYKYSPGSSSWDRRPPCAANAMSELTERQRRLCQPPSVAWHEPV